MHTDTSLDAAVHAVINALPAGCVSVDMADRLEHGRDAWPALAKWPEADLERAAPLAVVRPRDEADIQTTLQAARRHGLGVVPFGAGSGVVGGVLPRRPSISLDMRRMDAILELDEDDLTLMVEAGARAAAVEGYLNERGYTWGHYPQSLPLATVGGLVATRSSGTFSSLYGSVEDRLLAVRAILADGRSIATRPIPRSSTGPDLTSLFIGSEGALGVITQVTLRVFPIPEARVFHGVTFDRLHDGMVAVRQLFREGLTPAVIRLYDPAEAAHLLQGAGLPANGESLLILGFDGPERLVLAEQELTLELCASRGGRALGRDIGTHWERNRFDASWLQRGNGEGLMADAIEVSARWSQLFGLYEAMTERLRPRVDTLWTHLSHFYPQGGSIYFIVFLSDSSSERLLHRYAGVWETAMRVTLDAGGSISHHHGVGEARLPWLAEELGSSRDVLAAIKTALDPDGILSSGRLGLPDRGEE